MMRAMRVNRISKVAGLKKSETLKPIVELRGTAEVVKLLCWFVTMSNSCPITHGSLSQCCHKNIYYCRIKGCACQYVGRRQDNSFKRICHQFYISKSFKVLGNNVKYICGNSCIKPFVVPEAAV